MKRLFLIGLLALITLIGIGVGFWLWVGTKPSQPTDALKAIPADAGVVIRLSGFNQINNQLRTGNKLWAGLKGFSWVSRADGILGFADSLSRRYPSLGRVINDNTVLMSVHAANGGHPNILLAANLPQGVRESELVQMINELVIGSQRIVVKEYNGAKIHTILESDQHDAGWAMAVHRGVVLLSSSLFLVESAIGQLDGSVSLLTDESFLEINQIAGTRVDANVFINHSRFPMVFDDYIHSNYRTGFNELSQGARWTELDLTIRSEEVWLNGFSLFDKGQSTFYRAFEQQKPVPLRVHEVLPAQTAAMFVVGISDFKAYMSSYSDYLEGQGDLQSYRRGVESFNRYMGVSIQELYHSFFSNEVALAYIPFDGEEYTSSWFVIANTSGQSHTKDLMLDAIGSYARKNQQPLSSFERVFRVDKEKSVKIYRMPKAGLHRTLFGSMFARANDSYFTIIDSYIVFGASVEALSRFILANVHNKQLAREPYYQQFSDNLAPESNFTAYISPAKAEMLYGKFLSPLVAPAILRSMETTRKIQGIAIQLSSGRSRVFNNIYVRYSPVVADDPQTVWETRLDTTFSMKPQLVVNHNTQNREIFVQDNKNNIYLINDIGRVLWKRPLPEAIMGEVHQVDLLRNGKLQMAFSTRSSLYIVDRNGNDVEGFPVRLRSPATNPVAIFDYDASREYRFFIAGEDRRIYAYDRAGRVIAGWDFDRTERIVTKPLQHFRVAGRDYIVFADANRPYILDRRGAERVKPTRLFAPGVNSRFALDAGGSGVPPRLVTTDSLGVVRFIYLDGRVEDLPIRSMSSRHSFDYQDVNGNGTPDIIILDGKNLYVYNNRGKEQFQFKLPHEADPGIIYFHFSARDRKLGVVSRGREQIHLINGDGTVYKGFPLRGMTPFSIGQFASTRTRFNLVVGSSAGSVLNYAVQ